MPSFLASAALNGALSIQRRTTPASFLRLAAMPSTTCVSQELVSCCRFWRSGAGIAVSVKR